MPEKKKWWTYFLNKYMIVGIAFVVWMVFFDQNSYLLHRSLDHDIIELKEERKFFKGEIEEESEKLEKMDKNPEEFERLAREKYLMKRENEDIFVIQKLDTVEDE
ncbi:MAG: septum formation initiator family protein [Flavobacteriaceae bacterium]|nr:septum formation initiator family protein [Flavobacteriaceae bacterium]